MEAIDRLHTTAESHHRALIVEVMGRHAGWIALHAGLAGGANVILIPEQPFSLERVCAYVESRFQSHYAPILVVAEGATPDGGENATIDKGLDAFGHVRLGGIGEWLAGEIEKRTGKEARTTVLGPHPARRHAVGVRPRARHPLRAARRRRGARLGAWGQMVALRGTDIVRVPLTEATSRAEDGAARAVRRGRGLLRLTPGVSAGC